MSAENPSLRLAIARAMLGEIELPEGYCRCPGAHLHTGRTARKDCRVKLDGAPTLYCVHSSCAAALEETNHELRSRIGKAEAAAAAGDEPRRSGGMEGCAPPPVVKPPPKVPPFDLRALSAFAAQCRRPVTLDWIAERSPVAVPSVTGQHENPRAVARLFLDTLYAAGERVLIFTRYFSQGDFLAVAGGESVRLADKPGVSPVSSALPSGGREGVWFLTAPVTGEWCKSPEGDTIGRRHAGCVTRWPFMLIESDVAGEAEWLRALVQIPLRIAALYTSGGKSVHALVRVDCESKADFDAARDVMRSVLCPLGADGAAMTAVRLSRLPGCLRYGKKESGGYVAYPEPRLQRLVYLNPNPAAVPLLDLLK